MKKRNLEYFEQSYHTRDYHELYARILELIEKGEIKPVKASGKNGRKPALYQAYWLIEQEDGKKGKYLEELSYHYVPAIATDYYLQHPSQYEEDRDWLLLLNDYLKNSKSALEIPVSMNERSFAIWRREKFLKEEQGRKLLKRCGICMEQLNWYETTEPLAYYTDTKEVPQNILIVENKDTFYSIRRNLLNGKKEILGMRAGTLIYGAGKGILRSFSDFTSCCEPYMQDKENRLYYFGDLDYEGILIYEKLAEGFAASCRIMPFCQGYQAMLRLAEPIGIQGLPLMKEGQNHHIGTVFYSYFSEEIIREMQSLLEQGRYIPQEILCGEDFIDAI